MESKAANLERTLKKKIVVNLTDYQKNNNAY